MPPKWLDLLDVRLKEDTALSRLYEEKGPITQGAQAGCFLVMHKETGVHHSMRVYQNDDLSQWKLARLDMRGRLMYDQDQERLYKTFLNEVRARQ